MENDAALYRDQTISLSLTLTVLVLLTPRRSAHFPLNFVLVTDMTTSDIYLSTTWSYAEDAFPGREVAVVRPSSLTLYCRQTPAIDGCRRKWEIRDASGMRLRYYSPTKNKCGGFYGSPENRTNPIGSGWSGSYS